MRVKDEEPCWEKKMYSEMIESEKKSNKNTATQFYIISVEVFLDILLA